MPRGGYGGRRGRRRLMRFIGVPAPYQSYGPPLPPHLNPPPVDVLPEEIEAMRLVDLVGLTQEEAAFQMGISKRAFWEDLKSGRRKVIQAIIEGRPIRIIPVDGTPGNLPPPSAFPTHGRDTGLNGGEVVKREEDARAGRMENEEKSKKDETRGEEGERGKGG